MYPSTEKFMEKIEERYPNRDVAYFKQLESRLKRLECNNLGKLIEDMNANIGQFSNWIPIINIACEMLRKGFSPIYEADYGNKKIDLRIKNRSIPIFIEIKRAAGSEETKKRDKFEAQLKRRAQNIQYPYGYHLNYHHNLDWPTVNINVLVNSFVKFIKRVLSSGIQAGREYDYPNEDQSQISIEFTPHSQKHLLFFSAVSSLKEITEYAIKKTKTKLKEIKNKFDKRIGNSMLIGVIDVGHEFIHIDEFITLLYTAGQIPAPFERVNANDAIWVGKFRHLQPLDAMVMIREYGGKYTPHLFLNSVQNRHQNLVKSIFSSRYSRIFMSEKKYKEAKRKLLPRKHGTSNKTKDCHYYRGCIIRPIVLFLQRGKWHGEVEITQEQGIRVISQQLFFKEIFVSKKEAQKKSIGGAMRWIDEKLARSENQN